MSHPPSSAWSRRRPRRGANAAQLDPAPAPGLQAAFAAAPPPITADAVPLIARTPADTQLTTPDELRPSTGPSPAVPALPLARSLAATTGGSPTPSPELTQQLATLAAVAGALLLISQRVTTEMSWRSSLLSSRIERPG